MSRIDTLRQRFSQFNIPEKLILINVVCFVIPFFLRSLFFLFNLPTQSFLSFFELPASIGDFIYQPWSLFTYGFLHDSIGHIFWNMLLLYYASQFFLNLFSTQRFINVYFMGILLGGLVFILSYAVFPAFKNQSPQMVGASAGVMAVLIFSCTYMPTQEVPLLFFNVKLMYIGIALVIVDVLQIPTGNAGGHLAHIGGAALGYIYAQQLQNGKDIGSGFERLRRWLTSLFTAQPNLKTVHKKPRRNSERSVQSDQKKIDRILDKISASGYDSLTKEEKEMLFNAGKK
jgi:membrane associated rhomboid family serine protease